jgi:hypothetical protein
MRMGVQYHFPAALLPGRRPVPNVQDAGWRQDQVLTGAENLAITGIRFLDRPAHTESLINWLHIVMYSVLLHVLRTFRYYELSVRD